MKSAIVCLALLVCAMARSQNVRPSNTYVRTCISDIECSSINSSSYIFYDEVKGDFYLMIDFNRLKTGIDSVDFWLNDLAGTNFYFKAPLPPDQLPGVSNYNHKTFKLTGQAFLNDIWRDQTMEVTMIRADHDMLSNTIDADKYEALKVNLSFSIMPRDFRIHKKPQRLTNTIFIGIGSGTINLLTQETISMLGDAYMHSK
jgi:hypothetical protein